MPVPSTTRSPIRFTSRPTPSAETSRISAKALTTPAAAVRDTPKLRANTGMAGATMPKPAATKNATADSTATSIGSPRSGPRPISRTLAGSPGSAGSVGLPALMDIRPDPPVVQLGDLSQHAGRQRREFGGRGIGPGLGDS